MERRLLYLSRDDVAELDLPIATIIDAVEDAFRQRGAGDVEMPPKVAVHPGPPAADNFIHAMPAYIRSSGAVGVKWVSGYPGNAREGLPYISGLLILNDARTGVPCSVMDCTWITARRTAAASAVSARYLAREGSEVLGILGCGVQGRSHVEAIRAVLPGIRRVLAYDIDAARAEAFASDLAQGGELSVRIQDDPRDVVVASDVLVTAGPILRRPHATIQPGWLRPGAFASAVDFDSYFAPAAIRECDKVTTDDKAQFAHFHDMGYFQDMPPLHAELSDLVTGRLRGRESDRERTMAVNLGLALEDVAVAPLVYRRALESGRGTWLPL